MSFENSRTVRLGTAKHLPGRQEKQNNMSVLVGSLSLENLLTLLKGGGRSLHIRDLLFPSLQADSSFEEREGEDSELSLPP